MEDELKKNKEIEDNLKKNGKQPHFVSRTRMTTSNKNGRWPQKRRPPKRTGWRRPKKNGRQPQA